MSEGITVAIIVSIFSLAGTICNGWKNSKNAAASAKKDDVEALRGIITELKIYVTELEQDKEDLQEWAEALVCQVKGAGLEPARFRKGERKKQ